MRSAATRRVGPVAQRGGGLTGLGRKALERQGPWHRRRSGRRAVHRRTVLSSGREARPASGPASEAEPPSRGPRASSAISAATSASAVTNSPQEENRRSGIGMQRPGENGGQCLAIGARHRGHVAGDERGGGPAASHPLVGQRGQRELVAGGGDAPLRQVRARDRAGGWAGARRERSRTGHTPNPVRVVSASDTVTSRGCRAPCRIPRLAAASRTPARARTRGTRSGRAAGPNCLQRHVQRVAFGERRGEIGRVLVQAGRQRHDGRGQRRRGGHQPGEGVGEAGQPFGRQVDGEELDRHRRVGVRIDSTENGTTRARSDLMEDTEAADGRGWDVEQRAFPGHVLTGDVITRS